MRIAINIRSSRLDPTASSALAALVFRISLPKCRFTAAWPAIASIWLAICGRAGSGGIDLANEAGGSAWTKLQANQPLTTLRWSNRL
ncbi:hypothetical protein [Ramlibacter sp.]|uniref:hypothetical protein n=1 Tax=Ramlibacter sp. TaxID=1917967 RepID=UPI002CEA60A4|nr:hypothetical protein [Ramlibacter sp.]HWI81098.1 hypothetical protein [Ramlibacter sp.]